MSISGQGILIKGMGLFCLFSLNILGLSFCLCLPLSLALSRSLSLSLALSRSLSSSLSLSLSLSPSLFHFFGVCPRTAKVDEMRKRQKMSIWSRYFNLKMTVLSLNNCSFPLPLSFSVSLPSLSSLTSVLASVSLSLSLSVSNSLLYC